MEQAPLTIGRLRKATDRLNQYICRGVAASVRPTLGCVALFDHPRGTMIEATDSYAACRLFLPDKITGLQSQACEHGSDVPVALVDLAELRKRLKEAGSARWIVTPEWHEWVEGKGEYIDNVRFGTHLSLRGAEQSTKIDQANVPAWPSLWEFFDKAHGLNTESCRYEGAELSRQEGPAFRRVIRLLTTAALDNPQRRDRHGQHRRREGLQPLVRTEGAWTPRPARSAARPSTTTRRRRSRKYRVCWCRRRWKRSSCRCSRPVTRDG